MKKTLLIAVIVIFSFKPGYPQILPVQYLDPLPGAKYINKETNIIVKPFFQFEKSIISDNTIIILRGSKSGIHKGKLILSADGQIIIFRPYTKFDLADTVFVKISSKLTNNSKSFSYFFLIKEKEPNTLVKSSIELELGNYFSQNQMVLKNNIITGDSLPTDFPPIKIDTSVAPSQGYIFLNNFDGTYGPYIMILDNTGSPIFYKKMLYNSIDFKVQPNGFLTYYLYNVQKFYALNGYYQIVDSFYTGNNYSTDAHELRVLNDKSAYLMSYDYQVVDMSKILTGGDPGAIVTGLIVQQIDSNKNVIFQWRSWDHFQITDATHENLLAHYIDYVHGNAIEIESDGNIMISSRHLDEITKINRSNGNIIWRLGGKNNQFTFLNDTIRFSHQHFIRRLSNGNIMLFDNGNFHTPHFSRAVEYTLNEQSKTASRVWQYRNNPDIYGNAMGSAQRLDNGNTFICWGQGTPTVTEVTNNGSKVFQLAFLPGTFSYRGFRMDWSPTAPALKFPQNGETFSLVSSKLYWFKMPGAITYRAEISSDSGFSHIVLDTSNLVQTNFVIPPGTLAAGTKYYWRVNSTLSSGTTPWSLVWSFTTFAGAPSQVLLFSPLNGSENVPVNPALTWRKPMGVEKYFLLLSNDSDFVNPVIADSTINDTLKNISRLNFSTQYYWKVKAGNSLGWGSFSEKWNFTTESSVAMTPKLTSPKNDSILVTLFPTFIWQESKYADSYGLQISQDTNFINLVFDTSGILQNSLVLTEGILTDNHIYYWRVNASNINGTSPWSVFNKFSTIIPPATPQLVSPLNEATGISLTPTLIWNTINKLTHKNKDKSIKTNPNAPADSYILEISTDSLFSNILILDSTITVNQYTVASGILSNLTTYCWRIKGVNDGGAGPWSSVWRFTTLQSLSINLKVYLEGFWNGTSQVTDTIRIYLANPTTPFVFVDSSTVVLSSTGTTVPLFSKATNGNYYIVIKHRNHLETWSKLPQVFTAGTSVNYDFTTAANKAFGDNMRQVGSVWVLYGGDPNQDGEVGAFDIPIFISQFGQQGYLSCDFNGDEDVNGFDVQIISANFGLTKAVPALDFEGSQVKKPKGEKATKLKGDKVRK